MRVISMHKVDAAMEAGKLPSQELIQGMGRLMGQMRQAGSFLDGAGLRPSATRVRLRFSGGERTVQKGRSVSIRRTSDPHRRTRHPERSGPR
jgi:hypothetical protein